MAREKRRGHGEGSIYQAKSDGRWVAALILPNGKRKYLYAKTRKEVADKLKAAMKDLDAGVDLGAGRLTVAQYLDKWLAASVKPSVKVKTYEGYESIARVRVVPRIGRKQLANVTPLDLQGLYADLADDGLSARSVHHTHRVLHRAFVQAMRWGLLSRNPCDGVTAPKATRAEMRVLTPEQVNTFLAATHEHPAHALYALAVTTGMRQGELLGLRWHDVELDAGRLAVRQALQRQRGKVSSLSSRRRRARVERLSSASLPSRLCASTATGRHSRGAPPALSGRSAVSCSATTSARRSIRAIRRQRSRRRCGRSHYRRFAFTISGIRRQRCCSRKGCM